MKEEMFKLKFVYPRRAETPGVGVLSPGDTVLVNEELKNYLLNGFFELVKDKKLKKVI